MTESKLLYIFCPECKQIVDLKEMPVYMIQKSIVCHNCYPSGKKYAGYTFYRRKNDN